MVFLVSDESRHMMGAELTIDGGMAQVRRRGGFSLSTHPA